MKKKLAEKIRRESIRWSVLLIAALLFTACGSIDGSVGISDDQWPVVNITTDGKTDHGRSSIPQVRITRVWYGGTEIRGIDKVITAEGIEITNVGTKTVDLYGWSITDLTEGGGNRWAGEAIVGVFKHLQLRPGKSLIIENRHHLTVFENDYRPIGFRESYGIKSNYTIGNAKSKAAFREAKGLFRLSHSTSTRADESVWLINASALSLTQLAWHLENGTLSTDLIVGTFPETKVATLRPFVAGWHSVDISDTSTGSFARLSDALDGIRLAFHRFVTGTDFSNTEFGTTTIHDTDATLTERLDAAFLMGSLDELDISGCDELTFEITSVEGTVFKANQGHTICVGAWDGAGNGGPYLEGVITKDGVVAVYLEID